MIPKENVVLGALIVVWDRWENTGNATDAEDSMREIGSLLSKYGYAKADHLTRAGYELAALGAEDS